MSLLGGITDFLFGVGGDPEIPEVDWEELKKLMEFGIDKNRYNQSGLFTSNTWDDDKGTLTTSVNPQIQPGFDAFLGRVNQGSEGYPGAGRFQELLGAMQFGKQPERRPLPERRPANVLPPEGFPMGYSPRPPGGYG